MKPGFTLFFALATVTQSASKRSDAISVTGSPPVSHTESQEAEMQLQFIPPMSLI